MKHTALHQNSSSSLPHRSYATSRYDGNKSFILEPSSTAVHSGSVRRRLLALH
ncbi:MAG TPA: hypothetical protein VJK54_02260 [Chthoniobacterales bacterium]|nr:hypothetical protein [Chthoniobacterales bacterium]